MLRYVGSKPVPRSLPVEDGFRLKTDPLLVLKGEAPALYTLTREYYHWLDKDCRASALAVKRWAADGQRFPPGAYDEHNLFYQGDQWRAATTRERSAYHDLPVRMTERLEDKSQTRALVTARRNSL